MSHSRLAPAAGTSPTGRCLVGFLTNAFSRERWKWFQELTERTFLFLGENFGLCPLNRLLEMGLKSTTSRQGSDTSQVVFKV